MMLKFRQACKLIGFSFLLAFVPTVTGMCTESSLDETHEIFEILRKNVEILFFGIDSHNSDDKIDPNGKNVTLGNKCATCGRDKVKGICMKCNPNAQLNQLKINILLMEILIDIRTRKLQVSTIDSDTSFQNFSNQLLVTLYHDRIPGIHPLYVFDTAAKSVMVDTDTEDARPEGATGKRRSRSRSRSPGLELNLKKAWGSNSSIVGNASGSLIKDATSEVHEDKLKPTIPVPSSAIFPQDRNLIKAKRKLDNTQESRPQSKASIITYSNKVHHHESESTSSKISKLSLSEDSIGDAKHTEKEHTRSRSPHGRSSSDREIHSTDEVKGNSKITGAKAPLSGSPHSSMFLRYQEGHKHNNAYPTSSSARGLESGPGDMILPPQPPPNESTTSGTYEEWLSDSSERAMGSNVALLSTQKKSSATRSQDESSKKEKTGSDEIDKLLESVSDIKVREYIKRFLTNKALEPLQRSVIAYALSPTDNSDPERKLRAYKKVAQDTKFLFQQVFSSCDNTKLAQDIVIHVLKENISLKNSEFQHYRDKVRDNFGPEDHIWKDAFDNCNELYDRITREVFDFFANYYIENNESKEFKEYIGLIRDSAKATVFSEGIPKHLLEEHEDVHFDLILDNAQSCFRVVLLDIQHMEHAKLIMIKILKSAIYSEQVGSEDVENRRKKLIKEIVVDLFFEDSKRFTTDFLARERIFPPDLTQTKRDGVRSFSPHDRTSLDEKIQSTDAVGNHQYTSEDVSEVDAPTLAKEDDYGNGEKDYSYNNASSGSDYDYSVITEGDQFWLDIDDNKLESIINFNKGEINKDYWMDLRDIFQSNKSLKTIGIKIQAIETVTNDKAPFVIITGEKGQVVVDWKENDKKVIDQHNVKPEIERIISEAKEDIRKRAKSRGKGKKGEIKMSLNNTMATPIPKANTVTGPSAFKDSKHQIS